MKNWDEILSQYMDGELSQKERDGVKAQLDACENLRVQFENMQIVAGALNRLPQSELPFGLQSKMLKAAKDARRRKILGMASSFSAAAAAVLVIVLTFVLSDSGIMQEYVEPQVEPRVFFSEAAAGAVEMEDAQIEYDLSFAWDADEAESRILPGFTVAYDDASAQLQTDMPEATIADETTASVTAPITQVMGTTMAANLPYSVHSFQRQVYSFDSFDISTHFALFPNIGLRIVEINEAAVFGFELHISFPAQDFFEVLYLIDALFPPRMAGSVYVNIILEELLTQE